MLEFYEWEFEIENSYTARYQKIANFNAYLVIEGSKKLVASVLKKGHLDIFELTDPTKLKQRNNLQTRLLKEKGWNSGLGRRHDELAWEEVDKIYKALKISREELANPDVFQLLHHFNTEVSETIYCRRVQKINGGDITKGNQFVVPNPETMNEYRRIIDKLNVGSGEK